MSQVSAVGAESLAAGFAPGDDDTCFTECYDTFELLARASRLAHIVNLRIDRNAEFVPTQET